MANITLTYRCNLKCPYCFANEFVNNNDTDISINNFCKAVQFIKTNKTERIGLIGGEPTIHHQFDEILKILIHDTEINNVTIFTNGIFVDSFVPMLCHPKFSLLINCNSPSNIGDKMFNRLCDNLDVLIRKYYMKDRITLGINLYNNNMDYDFILYLLRRYDYHNLRISLTVPNSDSKKNVNSVEFFLERKEFLFEFFKALKQIDVLPHYDCNIPPQCVFNENEKKHIELLLKNANIFNSNLIGNHSFCSPVIDILPDLRAVRCFGMSDVLKLDISEFDTIMDLRNYFISQIDMLSYQTVGAEQCIDCIYRKELKCNGGCLNYKNNSISKIRHYCDNLLKEV